MKKTFTNVFVGVTILLAAVIVRTDALGITSFSSRANVAVGVAGRAATTPVRPAKVARSGGISRASSHASAVNRDVSTQTLLPALSFEKAAGSDARFIARGKRTLLLGKDSVVLAPDRHSESPSPTARRDVRIEFGGANREPIVSGEEELPGKVYHASGQFLGALAGNPTFRRVRYASLYRGIDAVFYGNQRELEFDFQVAPHADPSQIRLSLAGTDNFTLEPSGDLSLLADGEQVRLKKPVIYQQRDGIRTEIAGGYRLSRRRSEVRFELGPYDHDLPLIIDPTVLFGTYFGGAGNEFIVQLKANSIGDVYLMGRSSQSSTLPSHQTLPIGTQPSSLECFITKLSADGVTARYTVVFTGANCGAMEVTNSGKVHLSVAGAGSLTTTVGTLTESSMTLGALQGNYNISLGTFQSFAVSEMRVDSSGNLYLIVAFGASSGVVYELQKVNPQGQLLGKIQLLVAPAYPDGSIPDQVGGGLPGSLDVDDAGHVYVIGMVRTPGAITPTANAFHPNMLVKQAPYTDYRSDFLMRVNTTTANAFRIDYATFFGGSKDDPVSAVAFDPSSNDVVVAGTTVSPEFPVTPGTFAPSYDVVDNQYEGFLLKFDLSQPAAQQLIYGTFLNPSSTVFSLTILPGGLPVIAGEATDSALGDNPFPLVNSLYPAQLTYKNRQFLSVFSPDAKSLMFSTFLDSAPSSQSFFPLLANNGVQTLYEATTTNFTGLSTSPAFQSGIAGGLDLFARALDVSDLIAAALTRADLSLTATASPAPVNVGGALTYSIAVTNLGPQPANTVSFTFGLPDSVNFQSVTASQGSCQSPAAGSTGTITCSLGTIASGAAVQLSVSVTARATGQANASLKVITSTPDPNLANNTVNLVTTINDANNQVQLTTASSGSGSGSVTVSPGGVSCGVNCMAYDSGTTVTVTAAPDGGSSFTGFTGGGCGSTNPCSFTITASATVTATFTLNQYQLTTAVAGNGSGSVTSSPIGVSCGVNCRAYDSGTRVTVTATPGAGSSFTGFTGGGCGSANPCSFTITGSTIVTAAFTLNQYQLTTATDGDGSGSVAVSPSGVSCGANCATYNYGTTVTVTATPAAGSSFIEFSGGACGSANPCSFTITASTSITATFDLIKLTTATIGSGSGIVTVSPSGVSCGVNCMGFDSGTTVTVTATPNPGSSFDGFGFSGGGCSSTNPCSFTITAATSITATFSLASPVTGFEGYLYALVDVTNSDNKLYGFKVGSTGALTPLGPPVGVGDSGNGVFGTERLAYDQHHKRLYVLHDGFHYVSTHVVDLGSGVLTLETGPSLNTGDWDCAALHPGGAPLIAGDGSLGRLASIAEPGNAPTLATILSGGVSTGTARPFSCVFSQDGKFIYTGGNGNTNGGGPTIAGFSVNSATGDLLPVPGSPFDVGGFAAPYATDAAGRLFTADFFGGLLRVFTTSGGVPTGVTGNPFVSGLAEPSHGVLHPAGFYMLSDFVGNQIGIYQVVGSGTATTLAAVTGSPFPSGGNGPRVLALSDTGELLFVANSTSHNISAFAVDAATGNLTSIGTQLANTLGTTGTITGLTFVPVNQPVASPPSITKAFESSTIVVDTTTTLTFTLSNPNAWYLSGAGFSDLLPAGMTIVGNAFTNTCSGTVTVAPDFRSISLANGVIPTSGTCTVSVTVKGVTIGSWPNVTGNVVSAEGGAGGNASATLTVVAHPVFNYAISADPPELDLIAGAMKSSGISLNWQAGVGETVTLTAAWIGSPQPTGATIALSQNQVTVPTNGSVSTTLSVATSSAPSQGTFTLQITGTSTSGVTKHVELSVVVAGADPMPPTCGCTKTGAFVDPQVAGLVSTSPFATVDTSGGQLTVTNAAHKSVVTESFSNVTPAFGFSPNGKFFVLVRKGPPLSLTVYSVDAAAAVGSIKNLDDVLSWGFSPDDNNQFFLVTSSTSVNTQAVIDIYRTDTGARVMETTADYSAVPDWTDEAKEQNLKTQGVGGWGFSPDGYTFLVSYITGHDTVTGSDSYFLGLWNLAHINSSIVGETRNDVGFWQFSPCGDLFMQVSQAGANPRTSDVVRFLYTSNGRAFNPTAINLDLSKAPAAMVVANADGSRQIHLEGMTTSSLPLPPCTNETSSSSLPTPPTCGCTKTGAFVDPQVAGLVLTSAFATVDSNGGQLTLTTPGSAPKDLASSSDVSTFGFSPNGKFFVLVTKALSLTLYSVDSKAAVGGIHDLTKVLSWGFSPDDNNQFFLVTSSTSVNTQATIDIFRTDTGVRVLETTANYTATPDWTNIDPAIVQKIDTKSVGGWGFSPGGHAFLLSYASTAGPLLSLWNLANTTGSPHNESPFGPSFWQFSPCGDVLMLVLQKGANPASSDEVKFLYTSNWKQFNPISISLVGAAVAPSAKVVANADGSRQIVLTGMDSATLASPQCSCAYSVFSPANIVLMDQQSRRTGFDALTGGIVNQIAGGSYTGVGSEPQTVSVPFVAGAYQLDAIGLDSLTSPQPYHLTFVAMDATGDVFNRVEVSGMAARGSDDSFVFTVGNGPITPQLTPRDATPPDVRCAPADGLWHSADVSIPCTAGDVTSGLANQADAAFALSTHVAAGVETSNAATDGRLVCDRTGNCAGAGPIAGNKIDKKAPSIAIAAPAGPYVLGQAVAASYACADGGSGVASCTGPVTNGANINTQTAGANAFVVKASDNAGNTGSATASYTVAYRVCSLYTPVAKQSGSTYPIKIQLCDAGGNNVSSPSITVHAVSVTRVSSNTPAILDDTGSANPDFDFRYDSALGGYVFNLSTKGYVTGTYSLTFTAGNDLTPHSAQFAVK